MIEFKEDSSDIQDELALYFSENSNEFKQLGKDLIELLIEMLSVSNFLRLCEWLNGYFLG